MALHYRRIVIFIIALAIIVTLFILILVTGGYILLVTPLLLIYIIYKYRKAPVPIKIVVLGFPNAGKTVLLASMYHQMITQGQAGCTLEVKPEQRSKLINIYDHIADTQKDFPSPTALGETTEWTFTGRVRAGKGFYSVFTFTYLDFAGERGSNLFKSDYTSFDADFEKTLRNADILLGILDGQEVLRFMRGDGGEHFYRDVLNMLIILTNREKPVHFILTKWDLLEGTYQLRQVIERLEEIDQFRNFVISHTQSSTLRLIPVSSLGKGFAREENGVMRKNRGALMHTFQVEMPLICSLLDYSEVDIKKLKIFTEKLGASSEFIPWDTGVLAWLLTSHISLTLGIFSVNFPTFKELLQQPSLVKGERPKADINNGRNPLEGQIRNRREAQKYIYRQFFNQLDLLENRFPESNLSNVERGSQK